MLKLIYLGQIWMRPIHSVSCLSIFMIVYTTYDTLHAHMYVRYNLAN